MRYVTRTYIADECDYDDRKVQPTTTVIVDDDVVDTGLLDSNGVPLYRVSERRPIGFR